MSCPFCVTTYTAAVFYKYSNRPAPLNFILITCFYSNLWAHLDHCFYRMVTVQYKQLSLWKVRFIFLIVKNMSKIRFFFIECLSSSSAGSAVSVKSASDSVPPSSVSSMGTLADSSSGPASLLTTTNQTTLSALGHNEDLPPSSIPPPQHNK